MIADDFCVVLSKQRLKREHFELVENHSGAHVDFRQRLVSCISELILFLLVVSSDATARLSRPPRYLSTTWIGVFATNSYNILDAHMVSKMNDRLVVAMIGALISCMTLFMVGRPQEVGMTRSQRKVHGRYWPSLKIQI